MVARVAIDEVETWITDNGGKKMMMMCGSVEMESGWGGGHLVAAV